MRIEIAPSFSCDDWVELKSRLPSDGEWEGASAEWTAVIDVVQKRIQTRFFKPAEALDHLKHAGFAVLALDCLLLETIQAFRNGRRAKDNGESRRQCMALLTSSGHLAQFFSKSDLASRFFRDVRNGLLHDGETRGGWIIKASPRYRLVECHTDDFIVVNRSKFHGALVAEFNDYLESLAESSGKELRKNLIKALDGLCERSLPKDRAQDGQAIK